MTQAYRVARLTWRYLGILIALATLSMTPVRAQQDLGGRVVDAATGEALPYATAQLLGTQLGDQSNIYGNFVIVRAP
ncbi:MAG: hypothetical protein HOH74_22985, partial [Gemmatimonadetes bacterium]|nr:hypothetical protein [Gemmatimonadota bacterium]